MARPTITVAKIDRVLKAATNNGLNISKIDILADRVVILTDSDEQTNDKTPRGKIKDFTKSPFETIIHG